MNRLNCKIFLVWAHIPIIDQYFRSAYELYRNSISDDKRNVDAKKPEKPLCDHFKRTLSRPNVRAHFVGVW